MAHPDQLWRRFVLTVLAVSAAMLTAIVAVAHAVDPYDTGRGLLRKDGLRPQGPRTAGASRGRDPAFNAGVVGNSRVQLLSPERLDQLTGFSFVQLSIPGTGPKEQLAVMDWFLRHHGEGPARARALVVGIDNRWCTANAALPIDHAFPFWLYSRKTLEYAHGLLSSRVLGEIRHRTAYLASSRAARARPDGYVDYEPEYTAMGYGTAPALRARLAVPSPADVIDNTTGRFPAAERLREVVAALPSALKLVIVFPPVYASMLPAETDAPQRDCKSAFISALRAHPRAAVVDWRVDRPETHLADLFFDWSHYRRPLAEAVERDIAAALLAREMPESR